ncbi:MAG: hypothetical protein O9284_17555 [Steroidobacteraceae bacterium]|jgi:hypothetical protein|nr:hypothetical protein [Steroidobacteraceae bacterium]
MLTVESPRVVARPASVLKASLAYAGLAFLGGFVFGTIRELWLRPELGRNLALTLEAPFVIGVSLLAAFYVLRRWPVSVDLGARLQMGALSLAVLLGLEDALTWWLRGRSVFDYWSTFDAWAQAVNVLGLLAFAALPLLVRRARRGVGGRGTPVT